MSKTGKVCCKVLVMALLLCTMSRTIVQANSDLVPYWDQTMTARAILGVKNGIATANGHITGVFDKTTSIDGFLYLQKKSNGLWVTVKTWTDFVNSETLTMIYETPVDKGTYRLKFLAYVYAGSACEEITVYSNEATY